MTVRVQKQSAMHIKSPSPLGIICRTLRGIERLTFSQMSTESSTASLAKGVAVVTGYLEKHRRTQVARQGWIRCRAERLPIK
jgi:hypothetical protein